MAAPQPMAGVAERALSVTRFVSTLIAKLLKTFQSCRKSYGSKTMRNESAKTLLPMAGPSLCMHDCYNPDAIRLLQIYDGVWEFTRERALCGRLKTKEALWIMTDVMDQSLNFGIETRPEFSRNRGIILERLEVFLTGLRMKDYPLYRSRIRLALSKTSSAGIPRTFPVWISSRRRLTSAFQAPSVSGSPACKSLVK